MKKLYLIICIFIGIVSNFTVQASTIHTFPESSILSQGNFIKVRITESGVYKLTHDYLRSRGLDPTNVRMFGYGGAKLNEDFSRPKHKDLPEIAVYDTGEAILFFAQGVTKWTFNPASSMFLHTINPYSIYGHYFITSDNIGERKRIQTRAELATGSGIVRNVTEFTDYQVHEQELHSITRMGRHFFGERLLPGTSLQIPFVFPNMITSAPVRTQMRVVNISTRTLNASGQETSNHRSTFSLSLNGGASQITTVNGNVLARYEQGVLASNIRSFSANSSNLNFNLSFANATQATARGYLDFLTVNVQRQLIMEGTVMPFHNRLNIANNSFNRYFLTTGNENIQIWDVSNQLNVQRMHTTREGQNLVFVDSASEAKSYIAIDPTNLANIPSAVLLDKVPNQNIHGMEQIDYLIITHPLFLEPAQRLAEAHREINNLRVGVVTTKQVYNEFSSGTRDASAYRWAAKMFYDRATGEHDRIRYLLLFGKGSFDNRGLFADTGDRFVLTFQAENSLSSTLSYVTDDYFGFLDNWEGVRRGTTDRIDIGIGRFPVRTLEEAHNVVDKTIRYMRNEDKGAWKNQLLFVGDRGDDNVHMRQANSLADRITRAHPHYTAHKIMLEAFQRDATNNTHPEAKRHFLELLNSGLFFVNYMGHGGPMNWSSLLNRTDVIAMNNEQLPLITAGTCNFSQFDREFVSSAELLLTNPNGGAIGVLSSARTAFSNFNETFMRNFSDSLFALSNRDRERQSIGTALMNAKNATFGNQNLGVNTLTFVYFGCPAVRLNFPNQFNVLATEINGNPIAGNDTLRALSVATVRGIIADRNGNRVYDFNGNVHLTVQDKEQIITTLAARNPFQYTDRPNVVFRGSTVVREGEFEITFMVPRNIRLNYGSGRFSFYAWNETYEAQGSTTNFIIGGMNDEFVDEFDGPEVTIYLNDESFVSGGRVNATPIFHAHLFDINGINTSSITPGHDIMLSINNETWFNLNNYFVGNFQKGNIAFQLPEMSIGKHTLMFRVWDLLGNSTTKHLDFEVVEQTTQVFSVSIFPNPASTVANIQINLQEGEIEQVTVEIFDLQGRRVWTKNQRTADTVSWNLTGQNGTNIASGVYIYRVVVQTNTGEVLSQSNKIFVRKQ